MYFSTPGWDLGLFRTVNNDLRSPILDVAMPLISSPIFLWGLAIILLLRHLQLGNKTALTVLLGMGICIGISDMGCSFLKDATGRLRPVNQLAGVHYREDGEWRVRPANFQSEKWKGKSFPSAHAANAMAAACFLALLIKRRRHLVWLLPGLVGYSRIYLGKHFPSDVLAGWTFGAAVAGIVLVLFSPALKGRSPGP